MKTIKLLLIISVLLLLPWISQAEPTSILNSDELVQNGETNTSAEKAPTSATSITTTKAASQRLTHYGMGYEKRMSQMERRPDMNTVRIERPSRPERPMRPNR